MPLHRLPQYLSIQSPSGVDPTHNVVALHPHAGLHHKREKLLYHTRRHQQYRAPVPIDEAELQTQVELFEAYQRSAMMLLHQPTTNTHKLAWERLQRCANLKLSQADNVA